MAVEGTEKILIRMADESLARDSMSTTVCYWKCSIEAALFIILEVELPWLRWKCSRLGWSLCRGSDRVMLYPASSAPPSPAMNQVASRVRWVPSCATVTDCIPVHCKRNAPVVMLRGTWNMSPLRCRGLQVAEIFYSQNDTLMLIWTELTPNII